MDGMESLTVSVRRLGALGWAALLPVVMLMFTVYWGLRPWTLALVLAAGVVALLAPAVAADLLPVALIGLAGVAFLLIRRDVPLPPGSGTTDGYPLHTFVFGDGFPHAVDLSMGLVMLAFGVWLLPRTIGAHSGLAQRNSELVSRVLRLTATRVDAVDTAAAELCRVERDLHDGAQARLVALGISLRATERLIRTDPDAAVALVAEAREHSALAWRPRLPERLTAFPELPVSAGTGASRPAGWSGLPRSGSRRGHARSSGSRSGAVWAG
jgi:Histidine kinase